jgi:hypothetical protein
MVEALERLASTAKSQPLKDAKLATALLVGPTLAYRAARPFLGPAKSRKKRKKKTPMEKVKAAIKKTPVWPAFRETQLVKKLRTVLRA